MVLVFAKGNCDRLGEFNGNLFRWSSIESNEKAEVDRLNRLQEDPMCGREQLTTLGILFDLLLLFLANRNIIQVFTGLHRHKFFSIENNSRLLIMSLQLKLHCKAIRSL